MDVRPRTSSLSVASDGSDTSIHTSANLVLEQCGQLHLGPAIEPITLFGPQPAPETTRPLLEQAFGEADSIRVGRKLRTTIGNFRAGSFVLATPEPASIYGQV